MTTKKTAAQRAQEALDVAERRVKKLEEALDHQKQLVHDYTGQLDVAKKRRDYAAQHPDLPKPATEGSPQTAVSDPEF